MPTTMPSFRFVCTPVALTDPAPGLAAWAREMLRDGEIALLPAGGGLPAIDEVAHALEMIGVLVVRSEIDERGQERTVISYAEGLPLVWVAEHFSQDVVRWAHDRGAMTLLIQSEGPLPDAERRRIDRFVATLGRQSE